jgi:hypothetical protein
MQDFLYNEFDLQVSISTIHYILEKASWSRKAVKAREAERSTLLRNAWIGIQKSWTADQLVFLDESAANKRTGDRKYSWAPIEMPCEVVRRFKRSEK